MIDENPSMYKWILIGFIASALMCVAIVVMIAIEAVGVLALDDCDNHPRRLEYFRGNSMYPTIKQGDKVWYEKEKEYSPGDILVLRYDKKYFITKATWLVHRLVYIEDKGYITKGDNNIYLDEQVFYKKDIKGRVCRIK